MRGVKRGLKLVAIGACNADGYGKVAVAAAQSIDELLSLRLSLRRIRYLSSKHAAHIGGFYLLKRAAGEILTEEVIKHGIVFKDSGWLCAAVYPGSGARRAE